MSDENTTVTKAEFRNDVCLEKASKLIEENRKAGVCSNNLKVSSLEEMILKIKYLIGKLKLFSKGDENE